MNPVMIYQWQNHKMKTEIEWYKDKNTASIDKLFENKCIR